MPGGLSHISWEKLVKNETKGADEDAQKAKPVSSSSTLIPRRGLTSGVSSKVLDPSKSVESPKAGCNKRVLKTTQKKQYQERGHEFQSILVTSLYTIEDLGVFALTLQSVHCRVEHFVFLASLGNLLTITQGRE